MAATARSRASGAAADPAEARQLTVAEYGELRRLRTSANHDPARLIALERSAADGLTASETARVGRDVAWLRTTLDSDDLGMPHVLDILRAAEQHPAVSYGIDAMVCWGPLTQHLPALLRSELTATRAALDTTARAWLWGDCSRRGRHRAGGQQPSELPYRCLSYRFGILPERSPSGSLLPPLTIFTHDTVRLPASAPTRFS